MESILLEALSKFPDQADKMADLYKEMKSKEPAKSEVMSEVDKAKSQFKLGDKVNIYHTDYIGEVVGFNERTSGWYPGDRYPLYIKIIKTVLEDKHKAIGCTFEYSLSSVYKLESIIELNDDYLFGFNCRTSGFLMYEAIELFELEHENKASDHFMTGWFDAERIYKKD